MVLTEDSLNNETFHGGLVFERRQQRRIEPEPALAVNQENHQSTRRRSHTCAAVTEVGQTQKGRSPRQVQIEQLALPLPRLTDKPGNTQYKRGSHACPDNARTQTTESDRPVDHDVSELAHERQWLQPVRLQESCLSSTANSKHNCLLRDNVEAWIAVIQAANLRYNDQPPVRRQSQHENKHRITLIHKNWEKVTS